MIDNNICLTNWNESPAIYIPGHISSLLQNYHLVGIRFLYDAFAKKRRGSILNPSIDMNVPLLVSALLATLLHIQIRDDVVIISKSDNVLRWLYHLREDANISENVILINSNDDFECDCKGTRIFIISINDLDLLKNHPLERLFYVFVEDIELIVKKRIVQNLRGNFNIGITYTNFLINRDAATQYNILHWLDGDKYKRKANFISENVEHYLNLRDPYTEDWLRMTWSFSDTFKKDTSEQQQLYEEKLLEWAKQNNVENINKKNVKKTRKKKLSRSESKFEIKPVIDETDPLLDNSKALNQTSVNEASTSRDNIPQGDIVSVIKKEFIQLPCMDERPMLNSIKKSFSIDSVDEPSYSQSYTSLFSHEEITTNDELIRNKDTNILDSLILSQKSVLHANRTKKENDYLETLINDDIKSYDDLLDKTIQVDAETQSKLLSALFDNE